jgi:hypothetical protein
MLLLMPAGAGHSPDNFCCRSFVSWSMSLSDTPSPAVGATQPSSLFFSMGGGGVSGKLQTAGVHRPAEDCFIEWVDREVEIERRSWDAAREDAKKQIGQVSCLW